jgi:hypothetical protein
MRSFIVLLIAVSVLASQGCGGSTEPVVTDQQGLAELARQMEEGREAEAAAAEEAAKSSY